jgi:DNA-directed RNA polymerase specialized sigma subunit
MRQDESSLEVKVIDQEVKEIIESTVDRTIVKLKASGIIKTERKTSSQKTEELLKNYMNFKLSNEPTTVKLCDKVDGALASISTDYYKDIIYMYYFQGWTREEVAEHYNTSVTTISRNKRRLLDQLSDSLFSDDRIYEIFF